MPTENKFNRWDEDEHSPDQRCISNRRDGQCPYLKEVGTDHCAMHGANKQQAVLLEETRRAYRLANWQDRMQDFADDDQIVNLREEIGILRMVMEEIIRKCEDSTDLLMNSHRISDTALKIERLVVSCDKLERRMGTLLSKRSVIDLAAKFVTIINSYIDDPATLEKISSEMIQATRDLDVLLLEEAS